MDFSSSAGFYFTTNRGLWQVLASQAKIVITILIFSWSNPLQVITGQALSQHLFVKNKKNETIKVEDQIN